MSERATGGEAGLCCAREQGAPSAPKTRRPPLDGSDSRLVAGLNPLKSKSPAYEPQLPLLRRRDARDRGGFTTAVNSGIGADTASMTKVSASRAPRKETVAFTSRARSPFASDGRRHHQSPLEQRDLALGLSRRRLDLGSGFTVVHECRGRPPKRLHAQRTAVAGAESLGRLRRRLAVASLHPPCQSVHAALSRPSVTVHWPAPFDFCAAYSGSGRSTPYSLSCDTQAGMTPVWTKSLRRRPSASKPA